MPVLATLFSTLALAPSGVWAGSTPVAPSVSITLQGGRVVQAQAWTRVYTCELGGNLGAAEVQVRPLAKVSSSGLIRFESGRPSRRLRANLRYAKGRISGTLRLVGQIGSGSSCSSPTLKVSLKRR